MIETRPSVGADATARIVLEADDIPLLTGASATALITLQGAESALAAPKDALLRYPDGTYSVFVIEQRRGEAIARERRVEVGRGGEQVEILRGLRAGETIVIRGNESLRDGQLVTIVASTRDPG